MIIFFAFWTVPESTTFPSVQNLGMETSPPQAGSEASVPPSPPPLEKQLQGLQLQLDEANNFHESVRAIGMEIESSIRQVQFSLLPFYRGQTVPDVMERPKSLVGVLMENYIQLVKVLYARPMRYYTSPIPLRGITQSVVSILAFMQWIETGDVLLYTEAQERLGLGNFMFGLDIEDYFSGLCLLSNDLVSFVVSRVGAGDSACPDKVLNFLEKLLAAFAKLSLKNSFLQEKFDILKADLSKVEGASYDVKVFGFQRRS